MRPILGGHVPPERVIGRDSFIERMWKALENQSVVLVSERRIGKTSVIWKMSKEPPAGWYPIYMVMEGVRSPTEFIAKIYDTVVPILSQKSRTLGRLQKLFSDLGGQKIGSWTLPELRDQWKRLLQAILDDIRENFEERVVFLWDEFPLMVSNIKDDLGPKVAMELLDVLRDHRVMDDSGKLRMVYTGSVGLHLVVSELQHGGYRNDPTNDMVTHSLEGIESEFARELARQGLQGLTEDEEIELRDPLDEIAQAIAQYTDDLPYYINYTVDRLADLGRSASTEGVVEAVDSIILDADNTAHFGHYAERIEAYYVFHEQADRLAFSILNVLCQSSELKTEEEIWNEVAAQIELTDKNLFKKTLAMLVMDHYLERRRQEEERAYRFKYDIIRRWWLTNRG